MTERTIEGTILAGADLEPVEGRLVVEDGRVTAIEEAAVTSNDIVCPAFINAHTHLGDSVAKDAGSTLTVEAMFAPPDGLKHRLLEQATPEELVEAMAATLRSMRAAGTGACYDFREGGIEGVEALRRAAADIELDVLALGRGDPAVLEVADGYGASGAADAEFEPARNAALAADKPFAIHAGEVDSGDINPALDLNPDLLVHMVHAQPLHLERLEDASIPVVVCPRSNLATGAGTPPVKALARRTTVALGTDNVMLNAPSMFRELEVTVTVLGVDPAEALCMATVNAAVALGRPDGRLEPGRPARLFVLDGSSDNLAGTVDPIRAVTCRAERADIDSILLPPAIGG